MRIERVVGGTFNEASERSRQLFGSNVMLISSARVGDIHELLVCTDTADVEEPSSSGTTGSGPQFSEALSREVATARLTKRTIRPRSTIAAPQTDQGAMLVDVIRRELQALESRLTRATSAETNVHYKIALLEQGVSSAYAEKLLESEADIEVISNRLLADLFPDASPRAMGNKPLMLVGPASSGRTTVAMQAANLIASIKKVTPVVSAARDSRPGSREKFFAIADVAKVVSSWGGVAEGALVIDGGAYSHDDLRHARPEFTDYDVCLCIPAYLNRSTIARWLDTTTPFMGVIVTHWSDTEVPLGLLASMAERDIALVGVSSSADPSMSLDTALPTNVGASIRRVLALALAMDVSANE